MARLYDSRRWRKVRRIHLNAHPFCVICEQAGKVSVATVVDHITPHRGDETLFWDPGNWQSSCKPCHDGAKQQMEKSGGLRGSSHDGAPLDPRHHWNREGR